MSQYSQLSSFGNSVAQRGPKYTGQNIVAIKATVDQDRIEERRRAAPNDPAVPYPPRATEDNDILQGEIAFIQYASGGEYAKAYGNPLIETSLCGVPLEEYVQQYFPTGGPAQLTQAQKDRLMKFWCKVNLQLPGIAMVNKNVVSEIGPTGPDLALQTKGTITLAASETMPFGAIAVAIPPKTGRNANDGVRPSIPPNKRVLITGRWRFPGRDLRFEGYDEQLGVFKSAFAGAAPGQRTWGDTRDAKSSLTRLGETLKNGAYTSGGNINTVLDRREGGSVLSQLMMVLFRFGEQYARAAYGVTAKNEETVDRRYSITDLLVDEVLAAQQRNTYAGTVGANAAAYVASAPAVAAFGLHAGNNLDLTEATAVLGDAVIQAGRAAGPGRTRAELADMIFDENSAGQEAIREILPLVFQFIQLEFQNVKGSVIRPGTLGDTYDIVM